jgi:hypothetical protein
VADGNKTIFGDLRAAAVRTYRVQTESSVYLVSIHEERGRRYAVVRGEPGTEREHVVIRDSEPRIGEDSLFEIPHTEWVGKSLDIATMRTSPITAVSEQGGVAAFSERPVRLAPPPGMSDNPRIMPLQSRGTAVGDAAREAAARDAGASREVARNVVIAAPADQAAAVPYPARHVRYAEDVTAFLRSIHRRERIFEDVANNPELRNRLHNALDAAATLLAEIRKRAK